MSPGSARSESRSATDGSAFVRRALRLGCAVLLREHVWLCYAFLRPAGLQPLQGEAGDFARVFQVELVFDVRSVRFHGLRAEIQ